MHRLVQNHIEDVLAGIESASVAEHLGACEECRSQVTAMRRHAAAMRELRAPAAEPRPGFYARVMERIEAQGPVSIWNLFIESAFGRRIAVASLALALLVGVYLISSERSADQPVMAGQQGQAAVVVGEDGPGQVLSIINHSSLNQPSEDAVLANLVTYQEQ
jgi:predicted anti-sigma-YlaC factor YlaD